jgi:predicted metal-dependent phosphoesterase TrpH
MPNQLLLCELHAHTTWSDGALTLPELVDLYGTSGFDVLCVTDHRVRADDPFPRAVTGSTWHAYLNEIEREAVRALRTYGLLLIPGLELSDNHHEAVASAHVLALGVRDEVSLDEGLVAAIHHARSQAAAIVAAHPYAAGDTTPHRPTRRIWRERETFAPLVHRYELFNRREVFSWVAAEDLPAVATGDVHRADHLSSWKTLLPCPKHEEAVLHYLRSGARAYITPFASEQSARVAAAA